jgi:iron(III) transport system ATP-binding protein
MPELVAEGIKKRLGENEVLRGISLELQQSEIVALLGASGSGKTTLLRCVAGLETPDAGRIALEDRVLFDAARGVDVPAEKRGVGLVFQSYALWPHRTVFDNVAYALKLRKVPDAEVKPRVQEALEHLGLGVLGNRYPHQLSGGQQQRVALARAVVYNPSLLLMDEPLSNLDAKLREEARAWLREMIKRLQLSALYVTHDQVEAMSIADRILLIEAGQVEQEGEPQEIYQQPATLLAADFMGSNNRLEGTIGTIQDGRAELIGPEWRLWGALRGSKQSGDAATGLIRIEAMGLADGPGENRLALPLTSVLYVGERWEYLFTLNDEPIRVWGAERIDGDEREVYFPPDRLWIF